MVFSLSALWWKRIRGLWKLPDGRDWLRRKLGLVLMGRATLSNSLVQVSVNGWGMCPPCCPTWDQTMVEVMRIMVASFRRAAVQCTHSCPQCPWPCSWPPPAHVSAGGSWTPTGKSGSLVGSSLHSPGLWCARGFVCALQEHKKLYYVKLGQCTLFCLFWTEA